VGHEYLFEITGELQYRHGAGVCEGVVLLLALQPTWHSQTTHSKAGLCEHPDDVGAASVELPGLGDPGEGGGGLRV